MFRVRESSVRRSLPSHSACWPSTASEDAAVTRVQEAGRTVKDEPDTTRAERARQVERRARGKELESQHMSHKPKQRNRR